MRKRCAANNLLLFLSFLIKPSRQGKGAICPSSSVGKNVRLISERSVVRFYPLAPSSNLLHEFTQVRGYIGSFLSLICGISEVGYRVCLPSRRPRVRIPYAAPIMVPSSKWIGNRPLKPKMPGSTPAGITKTQIGPTQRTYSYGSAVVGKPTQG